MKISILGSSSAGNCYVLQNDNEALVIEAGVRFDEVKQKLDFNLSKVCACLISHEHGDHSGYWSKFAEYDIPLYMSAGTAEALQAKANVIKAGAQFKAGRFTVMPFNTKHDAAEPVGFLISHAETGTILFATDTYYLPNRFAGLQHVMIECNYIEANLRSNIEAGLIPHNVALRVRESHMELQTCVDALCANRLTNVVDIYLLHISEGNGDPEQMKRTVVQATGKRVFIAKKGFEQSINTNAF